MNRLGIGSLQRMPAHHAARSFTGGYVLNRRDSEVSSMSAFQAGLELNFQGSLSRNLLAGLLLPTRPSEKLGVEPHAFGETWVGGSL